MYIVPDVVYFFPAGIDSQYFDVFEKPSDICVVDLDTGYITL
jgi:hypothetical protein